MFYKFKCKNCNKAFEIEIAIKDYDRENRRNNLYITYNGKTQSLADWCRELNLNYDKVQNKIKRCGWTVEKAFTTKL